MQDHYRTHLEPIMSLDHEDPRKPFRRSSRLNAGSCEVTDVSHKTLHEDAVIPSAPYSLSVQKQHGPTTGKDTGNSLQHVDSGVHVVVTASEFKKMEINELPRNEANLKERQEARSERQEARSRVPGVGAHQTCDKASKTKQDHLAEIQSSLPFNIIEAPEPPEEAGNKR
uniref:Uncharacterized protein n=1 Tax=Arundo donax TaxID=35708 RepID=A0A0A9CYR0_ARUDO